MPKTPSARLLPGFRARRELLLRRDFAQPARRLVHLLEGQLERAVVHRHKNLGAQIPERLHRLIRPHVDVAETFRVIRANGQQGDFRREFLPISAKPSKYALSPA